jgi:hypothetical protein
MPQVVITDRIEPMHSGRIARAFVTGWLPPLAIVVAISARSRQSTSTGHCWK